MLILMRIITLINPLHRRCMQESLWHNQTGSAPGTEEATLHKDAASPGSLATNF